MADAGPTPDTGPPPEDAGPFDAGSEGPAPPRPALRWPMNGASTGSIHGSVVLPEPALTPLFVWDASDGADRYDLQITDECATPGFASCAFDAPVVDETITDTSFRTAVLPVSTTPPVGARYYWRVRACNTSCSDWSPVRYVDVGRQPNDFDGDGYADILAGAYLHPSPSRLGRAYVWRGTSTGPGGRTAINSPTGEDNARCGLEVAALGDTNADGFADAIIACYLRDAGALDAGEAFVLLGSATGLDPASPVILAPVAEENAQFARSVSPAGDVNGDGFADAIVSAHAYDNGGNNHGAAFVFHGGPSGIEPTPATQLDPPELQDNQQFGFPVASAGDVDGDGFADVLVSERLWDGAEAGVGRVHLFAGTATGASTRAARTFEDPEPSPDADTGWHLGGVGDIDGDYFSDIIVGARRRLGVGGALVYFGGPTGPPSTPDVILVAPEMQPDARFGFAVGGVGDVNGDGVRDVLIGARLFDRSVSNEGRAYLYYGTSDVFPTEPDQILNASPRQDSQQFGYLDRLGRRRQRRRDRGRRGGRAAPRRDGDQRGRRLLLRGRRGRARHHADAPRGRRDGRATGHRRRDGAELVSGCV